MQLATYNHIELKFISAIYIHWGKCLCSEPATTLYSGTIAAISKAYCAKNLNTGTSSVSNNVSFIVTATECAQCLVPLAVAYIVIGDNSCSVGMDKMYDGYVVMINGQTICMDWNQQELEDDIFPFNPVNIPCDLPTGQTTPTAATSPTGNPQTRCPLACVVCSGN